MELERLRDTHLIDPALHIWGWEIPVYLFLGGVTAGIMILTALIGRSVPRAEQSRWLRWMPFAAPLLLSIGMLALFLDLEYKIHVFRFYTAFRITSPMSWGSWILIGIYPAAILLGLAGLRSDELAAVTRRVPVRKAAQWVAEIATWSRRNVRRLEWANIILGIALGGYTGILLGTLGARALWSSPLLGPLFLVSGFSTGAALIMLFPLSEAEHHTLRNWDIAAIVVEIGLVGLFFVGLFTNGGLDGRAAAELFFGGSYTAAFWVLVGIAGLAVPLFIETFEAKARMRATIVAPMLLLAGGFALRWIFVAAGQVL
ncbi:MAG: NrfD/PsrC family molybdoenzyme membrane anchor subunit [Thermoanaerobaculia bacterium]